MNRIMQTVIDPVCETELQTGEETATLEYNGETYFFCSVECMEAFDADPESFLYPPPEP